MSDDLDLLREYRCRVCGKLLCKGILEDAGSVLEVKCRSCGRICKFQGPDAHLIRQRSKILSQDSELNKLIN